MPRGIASSNQLAIMDKVLASYCAAQRPDDLQREDAAGLILRLFDQGACDEDTLLTELLKRQTPPVTAIG